MTTQPPILTKDAYYKRSQVARILHISLTSVDRAIVDGHIKPIRRPNDRHVYFTGKDVFRLWTLKR